MKLRILIAGLMFGIAALADDSGAELFQKAVTQEQAAGNLEEAIKLYQLNLAERERLLGPDHPGTLNSRGNLAAAYLATGRAAEAIPLLEQTLAGRQRVLGRDHPDTQTSRKNLAKAYRAAGRTAEAIPLEQALTGWYRAPGRSTANIARANCSSNSSASIPAAMNWMPNGAGCSSSRARGRPMVSSSTWPVNGCI